MFFTLVYIYFVSLLSYLKFIISTTIFYVRHLASIMLDSSQPGPREVVSRSRSPPFIMILTGGTVSKPLIKWLHTIALIMGTCLNHLYAYNLKYTQ